MSIDSEPIVPVEITDEVARELGLRYTTAAGVVVTEVIQTDTTTSIEDPPVTDRPVKTRYRAQFYGDTAHL